jgi:signal transduction histidine kinase
MLAFHQEKLALMAQMQQRQKMETIGELAAGIAHEINTPMQYIGDNTRFIKDSLGELVGLIQVVKESAETVKQGGSCATTLASLDKSMEEADLDFLVEQIPLAVDQSLTGIERVTKIVRAMKEYAHPDATTPTACDLHQILDSMITVTRNEWKYVADLTTDFAADLPEVSCLAGEIGQVVVNLLVNGAQAIAEKRTQTHSEEKGSLMVKTAHLGNQVEIRISDTGTGIPEKIRSRVFDPFFTTKELGKGTGQGLALAYAIIVDRHQGELSFASEVGQGTTFIIKLPLSRPTD